VKLRRQEYQEEYNRADLNTNLEVEQQAKTKEFRTAKYQEEINQLKKNQELQVKNKQQQLDFKQKDFDLISKKMQDPNFVQDMRQDLVSSVYQNMSSSSTFHFNTTDGRDCVVSTIDNLLDTMVGD